MAAQRSRWAVAAGVLLGCLIPGEEIASAATGDLSAPSCLSGDTVTAGRCAQAPEASSGGDSSGLDHLQAVAFSPAGDDVYATAQLDNAIVHFDRNPSTGAISFASCLTGAVASGPIGGGGSGACAVAGATGSHTGMSDVVGVVVSPDGSDVYTASQSDDAVAHFDRNPTTGALTYVDCYTTETNSSTGGGGPCVALAGTTGNGTNTGLDSVSGIAISPGAGTSVYVTSFGDDAIARFTRNPTTGALTYNGCRTGESESGPAGSGACAALPGLVSGGTGSGIDAPFSPAVSADGDNVYVAAFEDQAVTWFDRGPAGAITWNDCITGDTTVGPAGSDACAGTVPSATATGINSAMYRTQTLALAPDDNSVYTGSQGDAAIVHFGRGAGGDLSIDSCLTGKSVIAPGQCPHIPSATASGVDSGLDAVQGLAVSPDSLSLYAASYGDDAIATADLGVGTGGDLHWDSCQTGESASGPAGTGACSTGFGVTAVDGVGTSLDAMRTLAVAPDGLGVAAVSENDSALIVAARSNAPETSLSSGPGALTSDPTPTFTFAADEPGASFQCRIDGGLIGTCSGAASHTTATLADGAHTFEVRARNAALSPDPTPATTTFTVDTTAPDTAITSGPEAAIGSADVEFAFSAADAAGFACRIDAGAFAACTSPQPYSGLAQGPHSFEVRAIDAAGNTDPSPASRSFTVDTNAPEITLTKKPDKTVKTGKAKKGAKFKFSADEPGVEFECRRDKGKDFKPCSSPYKKKYKRGKHTFKVRATDGAGNRGAAAVHRWKVKPKG